MNSNRNFWWLATLGLLLSGTPACNVLNQEVPTALTPQEGYSTPDRIGKSAVGMYDGLQNAEFLGGRALIYSDLRSDDLDPTSYFSDISNFSAQANNVYSTNAWTGGYRTIFQVNYFLQNLAMHTGIAPAALEAQYTGEGKFIRALTYFHLVNLYAQPYNFTANASHPGVPLQLTAPNDASEAFTSTQQLSRSTVAQVYAQIDKDLADALTGVPEGPTLATAPVYNDVARVTKDAVRALQSRVALYKGDYAGAVTAAAAVSDTRHRLNASPAVPFTVGSYINSESIFSVAMNNSDNPNTNNALGAHYSSARRADITVTPYALIPVAQFPAGDARRQLLSPSAVPANSTARIFTTKYNNGVSDYVPIVRYSEVLLNRAEGLAQTDADVSAAAVDFLNQVRNRSKPAATASYTVSSFASKQALIDAILLERRLELAFEGHRYYDLLRYKQNPGRINYGDNKVVLPIPLVDIQLNPNLVQNPGY